MQKAAEELKKQQEKEVEEKKKAVEARVPKLEIDGLGKGFLTFHLISFLPIFKNCIGLCERNSELFLALTILPH